MSGERQNQFLSTVVPLISRGDIASVLLHLSKDWSRRELLEFLSAAHDAVARSAAQCLGYVGSAADAEALGRLLRHASAEVAAAAEDSLWSIWMRAAGPAARQALASAMRFNDAGEPEAALALLGDVCKERPDFAEAHHQRGLILLGIEAYDAARDAFVLALSFNPLHFSAAASLGHIAIEKGRLADALQQYRAALTIYPHLTDIAEILPDLQRAVERRVA